MTDPKDILINEKEVAAWWSGVVNDPRFDRVACLVKAHLFNTTTNVDQSKGARDVFELLSTIAQNEIKPRALNRETLNLSLLSHEPPTPIQK